MHAIRYVPGVLLIALACLFLAVPVWGQGGRTELPPGQLPIDDRKAFHGAYCRGMDESSRVHTSQRGAFHKGQEAKRVICPLFRDAHGGDLHHVSIELDTTHPSSCTAYTMSEDGSSGGTILDQVSNSTSSTGFINYNFYNLTTSPGNEGTYWVECDLGKEDFVRHIYINEG